MFTWSKLKIAGTSRILRTSYFWFFLVPLAASLLSKVGTDIRIPLGVSELTIHLGLPFSWQMFYFSSVAFALGNLIFSYGCPELIRDYDTYAKCEADGRGPAQVLEDFAYALLSQRKRDPKRTRESFIDFLKRFAPHAAERVEGETDPTKSMLSARTYAPNPMTEDYEKVACEQFWQIRQYLNVSYQFERYACGICYVIGFVLISLVAAQNFRYVWHLAFST